MSHHPMIESLERRQLLSAVTYYVAATGSDSAAGIITKPFKTIQHALNVAVTPGDTILVRGGTYNQLLTFPHSGSAAGGYITLENYPGEHVILSGQNVPFNDVLGVGKNMIQIINKSYIRISGLEIANDNGIAVGDDAYGVAVIGSGANIQILNNSIHNITGKITGHDSSGDNTGSGGGGIEVYGSSLSTPYSNITITGNKIYNCQPGDDSTETLTLNGNIDGFTIANNLVHDNNNIGIDMVGGESYVFDAPFGTQNVSDSNLNLPVTRNGVCSHNTVYNNHANYNGGNAAGIYVDGGQNITLSDNISYKNDLGLEVAAETKGYVAKGVIVENNILYLNTQGGLALGGSGPDNGRTQNCSFINNTSYENDTSGAGGGQILIQYASNNIITDNIFYASSSGYVIGSSGDSGSNSGNLLDHNIYYFAGSTSDAEFDWNAGFYDGLPAFQGGTHEDAHSFYENPRFVNAAAGNFQLASGSPAIHAGSSVAGQYAPTNFAGATRTAPSNIGAY